NISFNYPGHVISINHPGGSQTTLEIDSLGRVATSTTTTGGTPIADYFAYDLDGNLVFKTDLQTASAWAFDADGHQVGEAEENGNRATAQLDAHGNPTAINRSDSA